MNKGKATKMSLRIVIFSFLVVWLLSKSYGSSQELAHLKKGQSIADLRVANLYADADSQIIGVKLWHRTGAPIYLLQIETVPQAFMWVDTPVVSNMGLPHALEHLLALKGTKGRYASAVTKMSFSKSAAATFKDFNFYSFSSGTGLDGFFEQFRAWLDALYRPDFTDLEAEREFYHFGVSTDATTQKMALVEKGTVYDEMQVGQGVYSYFYELNKQVFGDTNPFGFYSAGVPDEMRHATPADIRRFHTEHYRLGPTTGFIFALDHKENAVTFLQRVSNELAKFSTPGPNDEMNHAGAQPKYAVRPADNKAIKICPFPSDKETDTGAIRFAWKPAKSKTQTQVKLLELFFKAIGDGDTSLLYKTSIDSRTRELDSGATSIEASVFLGNSPFLPAESLEFSGIPGTLMTIELIEQLRNRIVAKIAGIANYPDQSQALAAFNQLALSKAEAWHRSQNVWIKRTPQFGLNRDTQWKGFLEYLDMDTSFVRSISEDTVWKEVESQITSGRNIWKELIDEFGLSEVPYATASLPSHGLLQEMETARQQRIAAKTKQLMAQFQTDDVQQALTGFEQEESNKSKEIDKIADQVRQPRFTEHPPLTPDDDIRYSQFRVGTVPVIASFFDRAPTIDLGLSFDLRAIPRRYYKYLPILPRCLDSLGLKTATGVTPYGDLLVRTQTEVNDFSIRYEFNPTSHRADLTIRASMTDLSEFRTGLKLIRQVTKFNNLESSNADRLRDLVRRRLQEEDAYNKGDNDYPYMYLGYAFRYQGDSLYVALASVFTRAHWDGRLQWLLHERVRPEEIAELGNFANRILPSFSGMSSEEISREIRSSKAGGLEHELLEYWERNIPNFSEAELVEGLKHLTKQVQRDLGVGPDKTVADLRQFQRLVLARHALHIDLTLGRSDLQEVKRALAGFVATLPADPPMQQRSSPIASQQTPIMEKVSKRSHLAVNDFPWFVGLADPRSTTVSMVFFADHPGYSQLDHRSLTQVLSANLASGSGPHTFFAKTIQEGLAYSNGIACNPDQKLIRYFAEHSPDIVALIQLVNSTAVKISKLHDSSLIDYSLQQSFPVPRSMATFTERGSGLAHDVRDGETSAVVKQFSLALLDLRGDHNLLEEIAGGIQNSIGPVLVEDRFKEQQRRAKSVFFFVGPERLLADADRKLSMGLLRLYPSDYWMDDE